MASTKPYFIRALHEWCTDEGLTPYLAVRVSALTRVPREFVRDGQIVLNLSQEATHQLQIGNDEISFQTRFNGASYPVLVPVTDVVAIYAKENGQGMAFDAETAEADSIIVGDDQDLNVGAEPTQVSLAESESESSGRKVSHLTRVK